MKAALIVGAVAALSACGPTKSATRREKPVPTTATSEISATGPVVANGSATSTIQIIIRDQNGAGMKGLTPEISASGSGNTYQACTVTDDSGQSTCAMSSTVAETKSISVTSPVAIAGASVVFVAGPATKLGFSAQPDAGTEDQLFVIQPAVDVQDAFGNRVTTSTATITLALDAGSNGTLNGTKVLAATAGRASFTGLSLGGITANESIVLKATTSGLTAATSTAFTVYPDSGQALSFQTQPGGGAAGVAWAAQPVVHILDAPGGALVTSGTNAITLTLTSGSGTLLGTKTVQAVGGVATFTGLKMENVGAKQVTATSPGIANVVSNSFNIVPGAPAALTFSTQPGGGAANQVWAQQPVVRLFDAFGNLCTNASDTVALSLQTGTGTLGGSTSLAAASGIATFTNLKMVQTGQKSLRATAGTLYIDSGSFMITAGTAAVLKFTAQPSGGTAGVAWATQPSLEILDDYNNRVTNFTGTVSLALATGSGTIAGAVQLAATSGVANFSGLMVNTAGTGKVLSAGISGITGVTSAAFSVVHNVPAQLSVRTQPSSGDLANSILSTQPAVDLKDAYGNLITSGDEAMAPIGASVYSGGGVVLGTSTIAFVAGQAQFLDLKVSTPGTKVLKFTKPNLAMLGGTGEITVNSNSFTAVVGSAAKLKFSTQPSGGVAGVVWGTQPVVEIQDIAGNRVTSAAGTVAVALQTGSGSLLGTTTAVAASGIATFSNLKMNEAGAKTLRTSMGTLATNDSSSFNVTHAAASQIAFTTQPSGATYAQAFGTQPVAEIRDLYGNVVTTGPDSSAFVNASLFSGTGSLSGTTSVTAVSGVATFTDLEIDQVGAKVIRLTKDDTSGSPGGTTSKTVDSASFNVQAGTPTQLAIATAPASATAGQVFGTQPVIEIRDADGNLVTQSTASVTVALQSGTGSLLGTTTVSAVGGIATFTNLQMNVAGDKTFQFTSGGLTPATSGTLDVKSSTATQMVFTTNISGTVVGQAFTGQPVIEIRDLYDNVVDEGPDATANVTASIFAGAGSLGGTLTKAAVAGIATFTDLEIDTVGSHRVRFTKADKSGTGGAATLTLTTDPFDVTPGAATTLAFSVQPGGGTAGVAFAQQPKVEIRDALGNVDTSSTASVTLALTTGTGSLAGTATVSAVAGVATFAGLSVDAIGTGKILTATSAGLTSATSSGFTITAGTPVNTSDIVISAGPKWSNGSDVYTVTVTARDNQGNPVAGRTVSLASSRSGADTITGSPATTDVNGEAAFTVKSVTGGTSTLTATIAPSITLTTTVSAVFDDFLVSAAQSSWTQDRVSLAADGTTLLTFSGTLKNAAGTALPAKALSLSSDRGGSDVITPSSGATTDGSGNFSFTVKSATPGVARLTLSVAGDAVNVTTKGRAQFLAVTPYSEYVPALASADAVKMIPGSNSGPVSTWLDVASGGNADLTLLGFGYNTSTSGWMGDGNTVISGGTSGPYRLTFDGSGDGANAGTSFNSLSSMSFEVWARPAATTAGRTLMSNAASTAGLHLRNATDGSARWEVNLGTAATPSAEILADSPSGYWRLNEKTGTTISPTAGAVSGTSTGAGVTLGQTGAHANNDRAPLFNGSSGWIDFGNQFDGAGDLTVEAWVNLSSAVTTNPRAVIAKATATDGYQLEVGTDQAPVFTVFGDNVAQAAVASTTLNTGTWYHLVGTRRMSEACDGSAGQSVAIYVNGSRETCVDFTGASPATSASLRVGDHDGYSTRRFPGRIDEVAVYNGATLSDARVSAHWAARAVPHCYSTNAMTVSAWTHLVAGFEDATQNLRLQVDGVESCNLTTSGITLNGSSAALGVGARISAGSVVGGSEWAGSVGDVRIYDQGINATDADTHYDAQSAKYPN